MGPVEPISRELVFRSAGSLPARFLSKNSGVFSSSDVNQHIRVEFTRRARVVLTDTARLMTSGSSYVSATVSVHGQWELTGRFSQGEPIDPSDVNDPTRFPHGPYTLQIRVGAAGTWRNYAVMNDGQSYEAQVELVRRDGTPFWCAMSGKAIDTTDPLQGTIWLFGT